MTREEKELLLKDLCARLPYGVMVQDDIGRTYKLNLGNAYLADLCYGNGCYIETPIKPYLRPLSSMTEKEMTEYKKLSVLQPTNNGYDWHEVATIDALDWLLANHLDFMGLIDEGLAIDCTNLNVY